MKTTVQPGSAESSTRVAVGMIAIAAFVFALWALVSGVGHVFQATNSFGVKPDGFLLLPMDAPMTASPFLVGLNMLAAFTFGLAVLVFFILFVRSFSLGLIDVARDVGAAILRKFFNKKG